MVEVPVATGWKGKDFIGLAGWSPEEVEAFLHLAKQLKANKREWVTKAPLLGKSLGMIFDKPSTRTRVSFEVGMVQLGGYALNLNRQELQLGRGETIEDTAKVLSRYVDAILIRTHSHSLVTELAEAATIPVINGLTEREHPCQALADILTLAEHKGELNGKKCCYVGDGNNVLHSLMHIAALTGMHLSISTPKGYEPSPAIWQEAESIAQATGATLSFSYDPAQAAKGADAVYTDVWASMGQEEEKAERTQAFAGYQVDQALMAQAKPDAIFLHCLPAYRGLEVSAEVIDGPQSVVFDQAENRLHAQKALLLGLLES
ncbi:ornithine carbamoyltransferase [Laceyella putida]|uniref:Ornithine carbamoyltransferase n=1 Tax=Laceyella putida TaxID=110101 RepID=A0ABW2RG96_9BACL